MSLSILESLQKCQSSHTQTNGKHSENVINEAEENVYNISLAIRKKKIYI